MLMCILSSVLVAKHMRTVSFQRSRRGKEEAPDVGVEPTTTRLKVGRSTTELTRFSVIFHNPNLQKIYT